MSQIRTASLACLALLLAAAGAQAQVSRGGVIDQGAANRVGLERSWFSQVAVDPSRGEVTYATLHVDDDATFKVYEVRWGDQMRRISSRYLDHLGRPLGEEGAEAQARAIADQLRSEGAFVEVAEIDVPQTSIYLQTNRAMLHAFNGETGASRWSVRLGDPDFPSTAPAASNDYVATLNGSTLYLLDAETGLDAQEERFVTGGPIAGPAISDTIVYVPKMGGMLEGFFLEEPQEPAISYLGTRRAMVQPTVGGRTVSWPTVNGRLYVANSLTGEILFRVETGGEILAPAMYRPSDPPSDPTRIRDAVGRLYFGSQDGYVYCVSERDGQIYWRYSTGQPISQTVIPLASAVYVVTDEETLYRLNSQSGEEEWWAPNVKQFLGASERRVYCLDLAQNLVILDAHTGGFIGSLNVGQLDFFVTNPYTDRIYLGTKAGLIQCLHETDSEFPLIHQELDQDGIAPPGAEEVEEPVAEEEDG